jgi:Ca-activated chloride channel family protein
MPLSLETGYNAYVPVGSAGSTVRLQTVISVAVAGGPSDGAVSRPVQTNLGIVIDKSGSMNGARMTRAKQAAAALIESLPAHVHFMVVAFDSQAQAIVPPGPANEMHKKAALHAIGKIEADGGTAMSRGLNLVGMGFRGAPGVTVTLLLTDGKNESESRGELDGVLQAFQSAKMAIHARGIGDGWVVEELRHIAAMTGGTADAAPDLAEMDAMLAEIATVASSIAYEDVRLRLQTFLGGQVVKVQQAFPEFADKQIRPVAERVVEVPLGALADGQSFDFLVEIDLAAKATEEEALVLRPSLLYRSGSGEAVELKAPREHWVVAQWSGNTSKTAQIHPKVASVTNQERLSQLVEAGMKALETGDKGKATALLGEAEVQAKKVGNTVLLDSLSKVIQRDASGTVRLTGSVGAQNTLRLRSGKTARLQGGES